MSSRFHRLDMVMEQPLRYARRWAARLSVDLQVLLERALTLAEESIEGGGGPFGAIVARDGVILGEGQNRVTLDCDPSAHAEVVAIRRACGAVGDFRLTGAVIVSSTEPCPMCFSAIHWARLERIYFATTRDDAARAGFDDKLLYDELCLPEGQRRIPMQRLTHPRATQVFERWADKTDRTPY